MINAIDLDDVMTIPKGGHYSKYLPVPKAIAKVNLLYEHGDIIKIFTARGAATGIDWRDLTERQLKKWGVKYHELLMSKPDADVFVDNKAVNSVDWLKSNTLIMVIGERGAGKSTVGRMFAKRGYHFVKNETYYLKYGRRHPDIAINRDEGLQDKIYGEVERELIKRLETSNVVYEATGANRRWKALRDKLAKVYSIRTVKVISHSATERHLGRDGRRSYPSPPEQLKAIKEKVRGVEADYEVVNDATKRELDIQVEGIAQKQFGEKLVAVSGAFDPIRKGHIRYFKKARELGRMVVIMRDNPSIILKKNYVFMPDVSERKELLESLECVNAVVVAVDKDQGSNRTLELLKPDIYAKGGDRKGRSEAATCERIGCEIVEGIVPVYTSSSQLVEDVVRRLSDGH